MKRSPTFAHTKPTHKQKCTQGVSLQLRIVSNERLLSLYDSPFPDAWERAKRAELIADINEAQRQLDELTSVGRGGDKV